jgi:hypothetical protein
VAISQAEMAAALTGGLPQQQLNAIDQIRQVPVTQRGGAIRSAVILELDRYQDYLDNRLARVRSGLPAPTRDDHGLYLFGLLEILVQYRDPSTIPSLLPWIGTGNVVMNAIVEHGELAARPVANMVDSAETMQGDVSAGLLTLERMLGRERQLALSETSRQRILEVAANRLMGRQEAAVVISAIKLAITSTDAELIARVRQLATDSAAIRQLVIGDEELVAYVQEKARTALGG